MAELTENLRGFWAGIDARSRVGLVIGAIIVLAGAVLLAWWLLKRDYQVLFTGLEQRDAAAIVEELKRQKVPYRIEAEGTVIRVPAERVHETRLALMGRGVALSGGVGFEIFDHQDMGTTDYTQRVNYLRALQGELARTILSIEQVKQARVHLVLPETSLFKRDRTRPKGSISLVLKPGGRLNSEQIVGIQRLVAASVQGLDADMVTIVDQRGVSLTPPADGETRVALGGGQLRIKREVEEHLARKVLDVLDHTFGPGQAIVTVDATLDFDEVHRTVQDVVPTRPGTPEAGIVVRKRQVTQKQVRPALSYATEADGTSGEAESTSSTTEVDYEISRRVEQVVKSPGGLRRVSVAVLVPKSMDVDQTARLRALVATAAGLDEGRGDAIAVHAVDQLVLREPQAQAAPGEPIAPRSASPSAAPTLPGRFELGDWRLALALAVLAGLLGLILGRTVVRHRRRRGAEAHDHARREALLAEIREWLAEERSKPAQGVQS